jgi:two-component system sensor histidine kinase BaeS
MNLNIRAKVILAVGLSLIIIFAVVMYLLVAESSEQLRSDLNRESKAFASLATTPIGNAFLTYQYSGTAHISQQINNYLDQDSDVTSVSIVSISGKTIYSQTGTNMSLSANQASTFEPLYNSTPSGYINQVIEPLIEQGGVHRYAIVYDISTTRVQQNVANVIRLILAIGFGVLILSIAATSLLLNRLFIKPIRGLSKSADIISGGNYNEQIISKNKDEIGVLANSLNKMAESLKDDITKLKEVDELKSEFMMIASHNLRTPISVMKGYMEMAETAETAAELKHIIETIGSRVTQLHTLAEDVLAVATLESGSKPNMTPIPMKQLLDSIANEFQPLAVKKGVEWTFVNEVPAECKIEINQASLTGAITDIVDNAIKFTDKGGSVHFECRINDQNLSISVKDTGIGIAADEMSKLFTKFHRGTSTLTYNYEGVGLGLYMSKLIINQHGGDIKLESQLNKGTTCLVTIPLTNLQLK